MISNIEEYISDLVKSDSDIMIKSCIPIYREIKEGRPDPGGTGILFEYNENYFLVSAAHVILDIKEPLFIPYENDFWSLTGECAGIELPNSNKREEDIFDFAFTKLESDVVEKLKIEYYFLRIENIELNFIPKKGDICIVSGYPASKNTKGINPNSRHVKRLPYLLWDTINLEQEVFSEINASNKFNFLVKYNKSKVKHNGMIQEGIDPYGMSGGGIWYITDPLKVTNNKKLIGIGIQYRSKQKVIVCTKFLLIFSALVKFYNLSLNKDLKIVDVKIN